MLKIKLKHKAYKLIADTSTFKIKFKFQFNKEQDCNETLDH